MTVDLFERYASLDPAKAPGIQPEWSEMAPVLSPAFDWSEPDMQTQRETPTGQPTENQSRAGILVAAAALVVLVIVGVAMLLSNDGATEEQPATTQSTAAAADEPTFTEAYAVAIASSYYDSINSGDIETTMRLLTPDAVLTDSYTSGDRSPVDEELQHVWNAAQGTKLKNSGCTATPAEAGLSLNVFCQGETQNAIGQAVGAPPVPTELSLVVTPEGITSLHEQYGFPGEMYCQLGQRAVVKDGTILAWTWPPGDDASCP